MRIASGGNRDACREARWILLTASVFGSMVLPPAARADVQPSERERTFLRLVFSGDEAKAVEYAQVAGINVNSIAGAPLGTWFYQDGRSQSGRVEMRNPAVQRIVFERFRQNPNAAVGQTNNLSQFCSYAPFQQNLQIESVGTPDQIRALHEQQDVQRRPHIDAMGAGFESLVRYGLKDRRIITQIFRGCLFSSVTPLTDYYYDAVLGKMLKAGADVNSAEGGERAMQYAVKTLNAGYAEKLARDGATVLFPVTAQCGMNATPSNLYGFLVSNIKTRDPESLLRIVGVLSRGNLPPTTRTTYVTAGGYGSCVTTTLYDAAVDAGNLDLARRIKDAAATAQGAPRPATAQAQTATPAPSIPMAAAPAQIGAWTIATDNGSLVAVAKADKKTNNGFAALRLECVAGRLEYVPVALKMGTMTSLWISVAGDAKEMKLVNQRASGASASTLSNEFAANEQGAKGSPTPDWGVEMSVESGNHAGDTIVMTGFSKMRAYMLANCKKA